MSWRMANAEPYTSWRLWRMCGSGKCLRVCKSVVAREGRGSPCAVCGVDARSWCMLDDGVLSLVPGSRVAGDGKCSRACASPLFSACEPGLGSRVDPERRMLGCVWRNGPVSPPAVPCFFVFPSTKFLFCTSWCTAFGIIFLFPTSLRDGPPKVALRSPCWFRSSFAGTRVLEPSPPYAATYAAD